MPRLPRVQPNDVPQHIVQRGNNREDCFFAEADFLAYLHWLKIAAQRSNVRIHAYALMTNHVHLLASPATNGGLAQMMQYLGRHYVHYINKKHKRSGTLWERRYRASLIEAEAYLLEVYRYIDLNPVRANMVRHAEEYRWSSARIHLGQEPNWLDDHSLFSSLGADAAQRSVAYQVLLNEAFSELRVDTIRAALNTGQALGSEKFKHQIEAAHRGRVRHLSAGRKPKGKDQVAGDQPALDL
jgi:putative transposase